MSARAGLSKAGLKIFSLPLSGDASPGGLPICGTTAVWNSNRRSQISNSGVLTVSEEQPEPLLRVSEVARRLDCSRQHIYDLINSGSLEAYSISAPGKRRRLVRVIPASLRELLGQPVPPDPMKTQGKPDSMSWLKEEKGD